MQSKDRRISRAQRNALEAAARGDLMAGATMYWIRSPIIGGRYPGVRQSTVKVLLSRGLIEIDDCQPPYYRAESAKLTDAGRAVLARKDSQ